MKNVVLTEGEIEAHLRTVQHNAHTFTTNYFIPSAQLKKWVARGKIVPLLAQDDCLILGLKEERCTRVFFAGDRRAVPKSMASVMNFWSGPLVVDIIGRTAENVPAVREWCDVGFCEHVVIRRLVRTGEWGMNSDKSESSAAVDFAMKEDAINISRLMIDRFDPYADRLPDVVEINDAIQAENVIVGRRGNELAGFLWYERTGFTATIRYWCVNQAIQGRGAGGEMIRTYRRICKDAVRHILWVRENNIQACACYQHYGYVADGLEDRVLKVGV